MEDPSAPDPRSPIVVANVEDASQALKSRSDLSYRLFDGLELHGSVSRQSIFPGALFRNCKIRDCDFSRSDFEGTRFEKCELQNVSFEDADIRSTRFADCHLKNCSFVGSYFSRNVVIGGIIEECQFDRATLLNNEFKLCGLRNITNQVSTVLHTDFIEVTFSKVSFANCTCLYSYFDHCEYEQFEINADSIGLSFGLPESALISTKLVFLGRSEEALGPEKIVSDLLREFSKRGWKLHTLIAELNFGHVQPLRAWLSLFDFFVAEAEHSRVIKADDSTFVLSVAQKLAHRRSLPMFSAIAAYDRVAKAEAVYEHDTLTSRSLADIRIGLSNLLAFMEEEFLQGAGEVSGITVDTPLMTEFVFKEKPALQSVQYLEAIATAVFLHDQKIKHISARPGSWIEVLQVTGGSVLAIYAMLYLIEGYLVRLTMIRARYKHLVSPRLPKAYLDRALDPKNDPSPDLLQVLAATYSAIAKGAITLPSAGAGIMAANLTEIRADNS